MKFKRKFVIYFQIAPPPKMDQGCPSNKRDMNYDERISEQLFGLSTKQIAEGFNFEIKEFNFIRIFLKI